MAAATALRKDYAAFTDPPPDALQDRRIDLASARHFGVRWEHGRSLGAWILPIVSPQGAFWGFQRKKGRNLRNRPDEVRIGRTLFGLDQFQPGSLAIVTESPLDAVYLWRLGYGGALAGFGAGVSAYQLRLLRDRTDRLVLALDADQAGRVATHRLLSSTVAFREAPVLDYSRTDAKDPGGMEPDEVERAVGHGPAGTALAEGGLGHRVARRPRRRHRSAPHRSGAAHKESVILCSPTDEACQR